MKAEDHKKLGQAVRISIDKKKSGNDLMKTIFVKDQIEGLMLPTIEDDGNLVLSYFDVFDDVFRTELKNAIKIARFKP